MRATPTPGQSALLDELMARRREIRERMTQKWVLREKSRKTLERVLAMDSLNFPPLPQPNPKSVEERISEAKTLFRHLSRKELKRITDDIYGSSADCREKSALPPGITFPEFCPIAKIQIIVARHYNITHEDILVKRHFVRVVHPRQVAMYLSKILTSRSLPDIGRRFGGRDHATVIHAVNKIAKRVTEDPAFAEEIERLKGMLQK